MVDTAEQVWESLTAKLGAFLEGLSEEERGAFVSTLNASPDVAATTGDDVAGFDGSLFASRVSPAVVNATLTPAGCGWEYRNWNTLRCWVCNGVSKYCMPR